MKSHMSLISGRKIVLIFSLLTMGITMWMFTFHVLAGQVKEREIKKLNWPKEPVKIGKLKAKGATVILGEKFRADDDWMKELTISIKNASEKTITYLEIELNFPRDKGAPEEADAHDRIIYGQYPALPGETATPHPDQPPLRPGDTVDVVLRDYEGIRKFLNETHYPVSINRLEVSVGDVVFDDGTKWSGGGVFRRDPDNPGGWIRIKEPARTPQDRNHFGYGLSTDIGKNRAFERVHPEVVPLFLNAGLRIYVTAQLDQCFGGCGHNWYSQDEYCGTNTRCAVRYDWVSCSWADPKETSVKNQYDRCVNRDTHVACAEFRFTAIKKPCAFLVFTPQECMDNGYSWNYTSSSCEELTLFGGGDICPDPPAAYQCGAVLPETACPYTIYGFGSCYSPVLVDVAGDGFRLTDARRGVRFDIDGNPDHLPEQVSWTAPGSDDAWLALDRNRNGMIDSGRELFGNLTLQPASAEGNGFIALAQYDRAKNGGNEDGQIDARDGFFALLRLWRDANHNGVSEAGELHPLPALGVTGLGLKYQESKRTDEHGNAFRYRAKVVDTKEARVNRWAWDVFLVKAP